MKTKLLFYSILLLMISFVACSDDKKEVKTTDLTIVVEAPEGMEDSGLHELKAVLKERNTGKTFSTEEAINNTIIVNVVEGTYDITIEGKIDNTSPKRTRMGNILQVKALQESVVVIGATSKVTLKSFVDLSTITDRGFVIEEIFFTGTLTPEGKQYNGDKYIKIYNNSDETLFADGLVVACSEFLTVSKEDYQPDIMSKAVAVDAIMMIPGDGKTYPVKAGETILIADNAINHKENNSRSFDLTKANFEWFTTLGGEIDNPDVTNMVNLYDRFIMHNRGFKSFFLGRLQVDNDTYLKDYKYAYEYDFSFNGIVYPMGRECYQIPNEWIIDAVNLSVESEFEWIVTSPSLDMSWTYCGKVDGDSNRYGKSVRRKVLTKTPEGRAILKDTNNSAVDFTPEAVPSLMESGK